MDNSISKEQKNYYKRKMTELEKQTKKINLDHNIPKIQEEIQQLEQAFKSNNIEDKIIGLQTSINPELIKQLFSQQKKKNNKISKYLIGIILILVVLGVIIFIPEIKNSLELNFNGLFIFLPSIIFMLIVLISGYIPIGHLPTSGPSLKEVKLFIKQNKLSENPKELKEILDRIKKTLYYNKKTNKELDKEIIERIDSNIYFLEILEEQLQEIKD